MGSERDVEAEVLAIIGELRVWPRVTLPEIERLSTVIRTADDAGAVLESGLEAVFGVAGEPSRVVQGELLAAVVEGWDSVEAALEMMRLARVIGRVIASASRRVDKLPLASVGRFCSGVAMVGSAGFAIARRADELVREYQAVQVALAAGNASEGRAG